MTTILVVKNPPMMFADSLCDDGGMKRHTSQKMKKILIPYYGSSIISNYFSLDDQPEMQAIVGFSGESQSGQEFIHWCEQGLAVSTRPRFDNQHGINGLLLLQTRVLLRFDHQCFPFEIEQDIYAVGSGSPYVLAALEAYKEFVWATGYDDFESVCITAMKIAARFDIYTGEPIRTYTFED